MVNRVDPESWWQNEHSEDYIICGYCLNDELDKSEKGDYNEEERLVFSEFYQLQDHETEPYQCLNCNRQSEGYDSVLDEE